MRKQLALRLPVRHAAGIGAPHELDHEFRRLKAAIPMGQRLQDLMHAESNDQPDWTPLERIPSSSEHHNRALHNHRCAAHCRRGQYQTARSTRTQRTHARLLHAAARWQAVHRASAASPSVALHLV